VDELTEFGDSAGEPNRTRAARPERQARGEGHGWPESISPSPRMHHAARFAADLTPCNVLDFLSANLACQRS
jgi:hypothetical protein